MAKLRQLRFNAQDPRSIADALTELQLVVQGQLDAGDPLDPNNDQSVVLAGDMTAAQPHNGRPGNIFGSWVEKEITTSSTAIVFDHNLEIPVINSEVNVRWRTNFRHSGAGLAVGAMTLEFQDGDTVGENSIELRLRVGGTRTVNGANPVRVSVHFIPVTRWPN